MKYNRTVGHLLLLVVMAATAMGHPLVAVEHQADVVVYGSTPGGFCAAIAAAREGADVILLEPTCHVGGLNTGGLSHSDSNQCDRSTLMGLFDEWHTRIEKDYASRGIPLPYQVGVKDHAVWTYEPHVAARVTKRMLDEAKVRVLAQTYLQSVRKADARITHLVTEDGSFQAKFFIDATYEGDLMAAAGVSWTIGRESREAYGESYAGKQYPKSKMKINGLDDHGKPLPLVTTTDAGPDEAGDKNVMVYSFRLCLTEDPKNHVPFPKPASYDPARFEIMRRYARVGGRLGFDLYRLPGKKFDGNNSIGGQFSLGFVGGGNGWCEADEAGRKAIWEAHKQYTLELYHFLTTDVAVPEEVRKRYAKLGLCKDEFAEYGHFSPALYVREGRRMRGMYVLRQKDILDEPEKDDPIVVSSFPIDSHDCQRVASKDGYVINEGTIFPVRMKNPKQGYPYHVPYRSILPKPEECTNLLVPVALSCTHVGISSIRVEPTWMILGQSAGIAAALAAESKPSLPLQELPYPQLRKRLLAQGQVLELPRSIPSRVDFKVAGHEAFVMEPPKSTRRKGSMPWVWYAPTLSRRYPGPEEDWMIKRFHESGIAIAGIDVGESYGSPQGRALFQSLYEELTTERGYGKKPVLLARSRGGLMLYNWAVEHPNSVGGVAGIYPVCNIASYPGVAQAAGAYKMTESQLQARLTDHNPVDRLAPLARAKVPILHIHGDQDRVVPLGKNSGELANRYRALDGPVEVEVIPGQGHNMWKGWFRSQKLTEFIISQALQ